MMKMLGAENIWRVLATQKTANRGALSSVSSNQS